MAASESYKNKKNKKNDFDFHLGNIQSLVDDTNYLKNLPKFPWLNKNQYYTRLDGSGWWMPIKQIVIKSYISEYLTILGKYKFIETFYIGLLSSYGMNRITKNQGRDEFLFPGTSINAALISKRKKRGFKGFFMNDWSLERRKVLQKRFEAISNSNSEPINFKIDTTQKVIDSNYWVIDVIRRIKENYKISNYLMVIDNEGMDIDFSTIQSIIKIHEYGDMIITFQDNVVRCLKRSPAKVRRFFGIEIDPLTKKKDLCDIYMNQLKKIGFGRIERLKIYNDKNFYYSLLFCCREDKEAKWLDMIEYYRNFRFKNLDDVLVKNFWDIAQKKNKSLDNWLKPKRV